MEITYILRVLLDSSSPALPSREDSVRCTQWRLAQYVALLYHEVSHCDQWCVHSISCFPEYDANKIDHHITLQHLLGFLQYK